VLDLPRPELPRSEFARRGAQNDHARRVDQNRYQKIFSKLGCENLRKEGLKIRRLESEST
jgi:hypothetical protein